MKPREEEAVLDRRAARNPGVPAAAVNLARQMGLCGNCENRATCRLPQARKAVTHCEEYR